MGSFSWMKADELTDVANVLHGKPFKFLIPAEFGGGSISDTYQGYGYLGRKSDESPRYDMYELLAVWNLRGTIPEIPVDTSPLKEIDERTSNIRRFGIYLELGELKYPLKLVSAGYRGTYEDCPDFSRNDPHQGSIPAYRDKKRKVKPIERPTVPTIVSFPEKETELLSRLIPIYESLRRASELSAENKAILEITYVLLTDAGVIFSHPLPKTFLTKTSLRP